MGDFNSKLLGTHSGKIRRIVPLKNYIVNAIDSSQEIKRLSRYYSRTPLLNKGMGYNGVLMNQPDLVDSLTKPTVKDVNASPTAKQRVLFNYAISNDVMAKTQLSIYVHCPRTTFNVRMVNEKASYQVDNVVGKHYFNIDIAYPIEFNELDSVHQERANEIACKIVDLLDGVTTSGEIVDYVGNCTINLAGEVTDLRLAVSDYMILTIPFYVVVLGGRIDKDELGGETTYA